jgi:Glucokinase
MLLVGDIGGTKTDLAVVDPVAGLRAPIARNRFPSGVYTSLEDITREFLADVDAPVQHAVFAVAGPVVDGRAVLTNLPWVVEESSLRAALELESVRLLNDVEAMAAAVPHLQPSDVLTLQPGEPSACDEGNLVLVAAFGPIADPIELARLLNRRTGIVEHGLSGTHRRLCTYSYEHLEDEPEVRDWVWTQKPALNRSTSRGRPPAEQILKRD